MSWIYLCFAIIFEVSGTLCLKLSKGFTKIIPSILIFVFYALSFTILTMALKKLDLAVVYAIWAGAGTLIITLIGILWFKEPVNTLKLISLLLIVSGIIGLKLAKG